MIVHFYVENMNDCSYNVYVDGGSINVHERKSNKVGTKIYYSLKDEHVRQIMHITYEHVLEDEENE